MQKILKMIMISALLASLAACSMISRKIPVEQGNKFSQSMVNQLKPGMTEAQVVAVMGSPVLKSAFDANRMDYVYTYRKGRTHKYQRVTLQFTQGKLSQISGTVIPAQ